LITRAQFAACRVLVVGDVMLDRYWFGEVERISPEAPVPVVRVRDTQERLGGAANVARNIEALGVRTGLLSVVGDDQAGRDVSRLLGETSIQTYLHTDTSLATTVKLRVVGRQQQMLRVDFENQPEAEVLAAKLGEYESLLPGYDVVTLSDYGKGGLAHITRMIELARVAGRRVLVDPKGEDYARYAGATVITPNRAELRQVVGGWKNEADLEARVQKMRRDLDIDAVLLTRSEEGMTLFAQGPSWSIPAVAREVFDVSGAGDTVIAVLAAALGAGAELREAVTLANRAGGIVVGKLGTATVSYAELFA